MRSVMYDEQKYIVSTKGFVKFIDLVEKCRNWRNVVVHGAWEWKGFHNPPIFYHAHESRVRWENKVGHLYKD